METVHPSNNTNNDNENVKCALRTLGVYTVIFVMVTIIFYIAAIYGDNGNYLFVVALCSMIAGCLMFVAAIINLIIVIRRRNREITIRTANILAEELIDSRHSEVI